MCTGIVINGTPRECPPTSYVATKQKVIDLDPSVNLRGLKTNCMHLLIPLAKAKTATGGFS